MNLYDSTSHQTALSTGHYHILLEDGEAIISKDNVVQSTITFDTTKSVFQFNFNTNSASYTNDAIFSNFKVY